MLYSTCTKSHGNTTNSEYKEICKSSDALSDHWRPHNDAISVDKDPNTVRAIVHSHVRVLWQDLHVVNACTRAENDLLRLLPRLTHKLRPRLGPLRTHVSLSGVSLSSKCSWSCAAQPYPSTPLVLSLFSRTEKSRLGFEFSSFEFASSARSSHSRPWEIDKRQFKLRTAQ